MSPKPRLILVASLWTLEGHPRPVHPWSLARKLRAAAEAGFAAVTVPGEPPPELAPLLQKHGLRFTGFIQLRGAVDIRGRIAAERAAGATIVNLQIGDRTTLIDEALDRMLRVREEARAQAIHVSLETHRNSITETSEKTFALAEAYRTRTGELLPLTWDHSHFAVVQHLKPAQFRDVLLAPTESIQAGRLFHCRPFNGQHAQIPVRDERGRPTREFRDWLDFAEERMAFWLRGPRPGGELWICPEYGPAGVHGYNLSTMPCPWAQTTACRDQLARVWRRLGGVCPDPFHRTAERRKVHRDASSR